MNDKIEIDVGRIKDGRYFLDMDGERILVDLQLSVIVDKIETELKRKYGIKENKLSKIGGFFQR